MALHSRSLAERTMFHFTLPVHTQTYTVATESRVVLASYFEAPDICGRWSCA
jgi:hypothetical protein